MFSTLRTPMFTTRSKRFAIPGLVSAVLALALVLPAAASAAPLGSVTQFSAGLNPGAEPASIAAGPDGSLWFTRGPPKPSERLRPTTEPSPSSARSRRGRLTVRDILQPRWQPLVHRRRWRYQGNWPHHPHRRDHRVQRRPQCGVSPARDCSWR